jgi:regulator of protease activity HflC (stomatin/prohibitin superfamily)
MPEVVGPIIVFLVFFLLYILSGIRVINEYERGVKFTFGKFTMVCDPGWRLALPVFQRIVKVDMRVTVMDVPSQVAITKDNVTTTINAVLYFRVFIAEKAVIQVSDYFYAISQLAQTTMRNVVGEVTLNELLQKRESIAERIKDIVDKATDPWGIKVTSVELKDIELPENLQRALARAAEAEREKDAVIIKAEGDRIAADNIAQAAEIISRHRGGLFLRTLSTLTDISSDQSNTVIFMVPIEILKALEALEGALRRDEAPSH